MTFDFVNSHSSSSPKLETPVYVWKQFQRDILSNFKVHEKLFTTSDSILIEPNFFSYGAKIKEFFFVMKSGLNNKRFAVLIEYMPNGHKSIRGREGNDAVLKYKDILVKLNMNNKLQRMYIVPEQFIANSYELDELPNLRIEELPMDIHLTSKRMDTIRNLTHKYKNMFAKIFAFWPTRIHGTDRDEAPSIKMLLATEIPVLSLDNLIYLISDLHQKSQLNQNEWNGLVGSIENFKGQSDKLVDYIMMVEHQFKLGNKKSVVHNVYYNVNEGLFRLKVGFRLLNFEVSPSFGKVKENFDFEEGFVIKNIVVCEKLKEKILEKIANYSKHQFEESILSKFNEKLLQFYERTTKAMDESLLELKLKSNYPLLREKRFLPIEFIDSLDGKKLIEPIVGNKNKNCMLGHLDGYNFSNFSRLQGTYCRSCHVEIKEMQENKLLMFLRDHIFNPSNSSILYCPEFNRFKIIRKYNEFDLTSKKLEQLNLSEEKNNKIEEENSDHEMNNEEPLPVLQAQREVFYTNYIHLCSCLKNMYSLTKSRIKIECKKEIEIINYLFGFQKCSNNPAGFNKFYKQLELTDPARGKYCNHMEFADLRLYYKNSRKRTNFFIDETVYECPICHEEVKDSELIYLKEALVLIKYIKKILQPEEEDEMLGKDPNPKKVDKSSIKIIINNIEKKVFVEYLVEYKEVVKKEWQELDKLYATLIDPYIPFSEYSIGLHKRSKRMELYSFNKVEQESEIEKFEKEWTGEDNKILLI